MTCSCVKSFSLNIALLSSRVCTDLAKTAKMLGFLTFSMFIAIALGQTIFPSPSLPEGTMSTIHSSISVNPNGSSSIFPTNASSSVPTSISTIAPNATTSILPTSTVAPTKPSTTTTKKPTEKPKLSGDYSIKEKGKYCLLAKLDASFVIPYINRNTNASMTAMVHMPFTDKSLTTNGSTCGSTPKLHISWGNYEFTMDFESRKSGDMNATEWQVGKLSLIAETENNADFINATESIITVNTDNGTELGSLKGGMDGYYMCDINETFPFQGGEFFFKYVKLQPFGVKANKTEMFGKEFNCVPSPTPKPNKDDNNIVPIAVGCALAGLVLIVLIAYIIGRRKSQRGYEKV